VDNGLQVLFGPVKAIKSKKHLSVIMKHLIVFRFSKVQQKWKSVKQLKPGRIDWFLGNLNSEDRD
jgi:hypothetical protein